MRLRIRNTSKKTLVRAGKVFRPDRKWREYNIADYRAAEVLASTQLEVKQLDEPVEGDTDTEEPVDEPTGGGGETNEDTGDGEVSGDEGEGEEEPTDEDDDEIELTELDYRELQSMAKEYGIPANQGRDELIEAIAEASEEE